MTAEGATCLDAGMVGTEMLYYLVGSRELDGGLMCTASHNPKAYTGAKMVKRGAIALSGDAGIGDIRQLICRTVSTNHTAAARSRHVDVYAGVPRRAALKFIDPAAIRPLHVVVDGGNGMAGPMVGPLLDTLGLELETGLLDAGRELPRPRAQPAAAGEPRVHHARGRPRGADLGIAWDGDADRCFFIDDTGAFVDGDFLTALLADSMLRRYPGATILYDVAPAAPLPTSSQRAGGTALINRVGHAFFKTRMRDEGGVFGGEVSGHYYFRDFYCADSGTIPALLILELLSRSEHKLSELLEPFHSRYFISGEINTEVADPAGKIAEIAERYADARQSTLDGISIDYDDWHFNVRPSNTEPLLRLCLESLRLPRRTWSAAATRSSS